jgi:hypothetical protein
MVVIVLVVEPGVMVGGSGTISATTVSAMMTTAIAMTGWVNGD